MLQCNFLPFTQHSRQLKGLFGSQLRIRCQIRLQANAQSPVIFRPIPAYSQERRLCEASEKAFCRGEPSRSTWLCSDERMGWDAAEYERATIAGKSIANKLPGRSSKGRSLCLGDIGL